MIMKESDAKLPVFHTQECGQVPASFDYSPAPANISELIV